MTKKSFATVGAWITSGYLILGILNLYDLIDRLDKLSNSLHWLVAWWRFVTASFFAFIGLKINEFGQTIIALIVIATSAATIYSLALHRRTAAGFVVRRAMERLANDDQPGKWKTGDELAGYEPRFFDPEDALALVIGMITVIAAIVTLCEVSEPIRKIMIWSSFATVLVAFLTRTGLFWPIINSMQHRLKFPTRLSCLLLVVPTIPVMLIFLVPAVIAPFKKAAGWIVAVVVLMLIGNWLAANYLDPLMPFLKNLPPAPPPPSLG